MTAPELATELERIAQQLRTGCSNHSCVISPKKPGQLGTNASCCCRPREISRAIIDLGTYIKDHYAKRHNNWHGPVCHCGDYIGEGVCRDGAPVTCVPMDPQP